MPDTLNDDIGPGDAQVILNDPSAQNDPEYAANLRRATLASSVGSALEYFDFALYGLSTALIFNVLFFPQDNPAMATVAAFATYGVGFLARPFGGLFFGRLGDRIGRKWVLVATILLMGGASTAIGLLPTYEAIGILAPIMLVILRMLQGFGAGAEQAGATVLMAEYAPVRRRGFFSALPFVGIQAGTLLAALVFSLITLLPEDQLLSWGWRIPFLASFLLILIALFIRMRLRETPTFIELEKHEQIAERPVRGDLHPWPAGRDRRHRTPYGRERRLVHVQHPRPRLLRRDRGGGCRPQPARLGCHHRFADRHLLGAAHRGDLGSGRPSHGVPLRSGLPPVCTRSPRGGCCRSATTGSPSRWSPSESASASTRCSDRSARCCPSSSATGTATSASRWPENCRPCIAGGLAGVLGAYIIAVSNGNWLAPGDLHGNARAHHDRRRRSWSPRPCAATSPAWMTPSRCRVRRPARTSRRRPSRSGPSSGDGHRSVRPDRPHRAGHRLRAGDRAHARRGSRARRRHGDRATAETRRRRRGLRRDRGVERTQRVQRGLRRHRHRRRRCRASRRSKPSTDRSTSS